MSIEKQLANFFFLKFCRLCSFHEKIQENPSSIFVMWSAVAQLVEHKTGDGRIASLSLIAGTVTVLCP